MIQQSIIKFARRVVERVTDQLLQNLDRIQEEAAAPMQAMIEQVGGGAWIGDGANAFVEELSNLVLPGIGKIGEGVSTYNSNLQNAINVLDSADEQVNSIVNGVADTFDAIF